MTMNATAGCDICVGYEVEEQVGTLPLPAGFCRNATSLPVGVKVVAA
jgi:hypothetical protein